jgi:hypothetical protein
MRDASAFVIKGDMPAFVTKVYAPLVSASPFTCVIGDVQ